MNCFNLNQLPSTKYWVVILCLFILFNSCKQNERAYCATPTGETQTFIEMGNDRLNLQTKIWTDYKREPFGVISGLISDKEILQLCNSLGFEVEELRNLQSIVLYLGSQSRKDFKTISIHEVKGLSLYSFDSEKLYHKLFIKDISNKLINISELNAYTDAVETGDLNSILTHILPNNGYQAYIILKNNTNSQKVSIKIDQLSPLLEKYQKEILRVSVPPSSCPFPCAKTEKGSCNVDEEGNLLDCQQDCGSRVVHGLVGVSNESTQENFSLYYRFRDEFLESSNFGLKYVRYYNEFSSDVVHTIDMSMAQDMIDLLNLCKPSIEKVLEPDAGQSTYILITPQIAQKAVSILNQYKLQTEDDELKDIIEDVMVDINTYTGKTASYVLASCSN
jgi:hypothetical protein